MDLEYFEIIAVRRIILYDLEMDESTKKISKSLLANPPGLEFDTCRIDICSYDDIFKVVR